MVKPPRRRIRDERAFRPRRSSDPASSITRRNCRTLLARSFRLRPGRALDRISRERSTAFSTEYCVAQCARQSSSPSRSTSHRFVEFDCEQGRRSVAEHLSTAQRQRIRNAPIPKSVVDREDSTMGHHLPGVIMNRESEQKKKRAQIQKSTDENVRKQKHQESPKPPVKR